VFKNINAFLRTIVIAGLVGLGGFWSFFLHRQVTEHERSLEARDQKIETMTVALEAGERRIVELDQAVAEKDATIKVQTATIETQEATIEEQEAAIEELEVSMYLLKVDLRLAKIEVLDQRGNPDNPDELETRLRFIELTPEGKPIGPGREIVVQGRYVYLESLVIKFDDTYVEHGDFLRGSSVCMFRRIFGENQRPSEGEALDPESAWPMPYSAEEGTSPFYEDLWKRFWDYANDPELARSKGVRAIHGEAPFVEMRPGKTYRVELRSSGGLTIRAEE